MINIQSKFSRNRLVSSCLIGLVLFFNLQCAVLFILFPQKYTGQFDLNIPNGSSIIQAIGVLFLMWNIPYVVSFANPIKHKVSLVESICMQGIGVIGETLIIITNQYLPINTQTSLIRFIIFDTAGLILLIIAFFFAKQS